jgi:hypothetical protein
MATINKFATRLVIQQEFASIVVAIEARTERKQRTEPQCSRMLERITIHSALAGILQDLNEILRLMTKMIVQLPVRFNEDKQRRQNPQTQSHEQRIRSSSAYAL